MSAAIRNILATGLTALLASCGGGAGVPASEDTGPLPPTICEVARPQTVSVQTTGGQPVVSKDDYLDARIAIGGVTVDTQIRGRGNSTWGMPKKPYRLKLREKAPLFGMPAERDWVLLANYSDKTLLRNALAFCIANVLELEHTPQSYPVELTLNGEYLGLYLLTEQVEAGSARVDIGDEDGSGFLIEWDSRSDGDPDAFRTARGSPFLVQSDATATQARAIRQFVDAVEADLFAYSPRVFDTVDMRSMAAFYLVNEVMRNNDFFHSSTYLYRAEGGPLRFGPVWDFDIAAGNIDFNDNWRTDGWFARNTAYMGAAWLTPGFDAEVRRQWALLQSRAGELDQFLDVSAQALEAAQRRNFQRWEILNLRVWPNRVALGSHEAEVDDLRQWLSARISWLDGRLGAAAD